MRSPANFNSTILYVEPPKFWPERGDWGIVRILSTIILCETALLVYLVWGTA